MENDYKRKFKRKNVNPITDEDINSYCFESENISPNIRALPVKKRNDPKKELRPIQIDIEKACKQKKLILSGIEVFFPYEPYPNQKVYMEKVIQACQKNTIAGLESPTGTGKTLCLLCASLAYLRHERQRLIEERDNNFDVIDRTDKIKQPVIYYTSRTHAQLANVIQELHKTCYKPVNAVISSREQMCINGLIKGYNRTFFNMKCQNLLKTNQCRYFKGKGNINYTWSAYDGKTIEELKSIAKERKFCPYFFERDKSIHSDLIFLPYNYIFDRDIKKKMNIQMKNSILIVDEAHNLQDICNDSVSKDIDSIMIEEVLKDLKEVKIKLEENQAGMGLDMELGGGKNSKIINLEPINIEQLKNEINILTNIKNSLLNLKVQTGDKWPNFGLKLEAKNLFDLFYLGSRGEDKKQNTIKFNNINPPKSNNKKSENKNNMRSSEKNDKNISNISYEEYDEDLGNNSEDEYTINSEQIETDLDPNNISTHINYLMNVEFFIHNNQGKKTYLGQYIEILELIKLLGDNFIEVETCDDSNPLNNYANNFKFFVEDVEDISNKNINFNAKKKTLNNFVKKKKRVLHIYCFNPGFGFKNIINEKLHATIITSGTLSPIDGMESELKCSFEVKLEGTHVIDKKQVHFGILTSSLFDKKEEFIFNALNRNNNQMINNLGKTIVELCKVTPGGILVFFGSYQVMEDFIKKWEKSKIISEISKYKEFCQDKRDQAQNKKVLDLYQKRNSSREEKGAILFSVCRGSCSEGMNFKNDAARLVIVVGIPFAYLGDPKTQLRKEYQDQFNKLYYPFIKDKNIKKLSGSEWYNQNAIKCVNQALGRVIRHSNDYGCMLLIDSRYQQNNNRNLISKWIRDVCIVYNNKNNDRLITDVKNFFIEAENFTNKKIEEQKKLNEIQIIQELKESSKKNKIKNKKQRNDKIINDEEFLDEEELKYTEELIRNTIKKNRNKENLERLNDDKHFNIINDIKIDEIINSSSNNNQKEKMKKIKNKKNSKNNNINNNISINNSNQKDPFLDNNLDFLAIFGDDINQSQKKQNEENDNDNNMNNPKEKKDEEKNEENNNTPIPDEFENIDINFFNDLKEAKNSTIKKERPKNNLNNNDINNIDDNKKEEEKQNNVESNKNNFTLDQLIEQLVQQKDNIDLKKELEKRGLSFSLKEKSSESSKSTVKNLLTCPICYKTSEDENVKIEILKCGHFICKQCIDTMKEKSDNVKKLKCPICQAKLKEVNTAYI